MHQVMVNWLVTLIITAVFKLAFPVFFCCFR